MHAFHEYLCQQLDDMLRKHSVIVFYDPLRELLPFFERELSEVDTDYAGLRRVSIGERMTFVARYQGSFFGLRAAVEPIADQDTPEALIVYLPGVTRGRQGMGVELAQQLPGTRDLTMRPALAALPSITPIGMAALLPGASSSFSVVDHKGKLAASIEGTAMPGLTERLKLLKARVPDVVEMTLGKLLGTPPAKLAKTIGNASLVVVRSQEIDFVGEIDGDLLARQVMDTIMARISTVPPVYCTSDLAARPVWA